MPPVTESAHVMRFCVGAGALVSEGDGDGDGGGAAA
jgi:hypothetical protein